MEYTNNENIIINNVFCNNCGKQGHFFHQCKIPITSIGVVIFRIVDKNNTDTKCQETNNGLIQNEEKHIEYLMIRRKDTLGYIDFMRGKYSVHNKYYIINMLRQMTLLEKEKIKEGNFNQLWKEIWGDQSILNKYKIEEGISRDKFNNLLTGVLVKDEFYTLETLIEESNKFVKDLWEEPEWGFPKGRRNFLEKDYDCAIRECCEETGFKQNVLKNIQNVLPYEEIFSGSNYKSYKHKYYLMYIKYNDSLEINNYQKAEVSKMEWKSYNEADNCIRYYNLEKKRMLNRIDKMLRKYKLCLF